MISKYYYLKLFKYVFFKFRIQFQSVVQHEQFSWSPALEAELVRLAEQSVRRGMGRKKWNHQRSIDTHFVTARMNAFCEKLAAEAAVAQNLCGSCSNAAMAATAYTPAHNQLTYDQVRCKWKRMVGALAKLQ